MAIEFTAWADQVDASTQVVSVRGEIDLFTAPEFKQHVNGAIDEGRRLVIVDLNEATFIDSSSLGILISAHRRLRGRGGRLVIACDVAPILNTFSITGLDSVMEMAPSREEAIALSAREDAAAAAAAVA